MKMRSSKLNIVCKSLRIAELSSIYNHEKAFTHKQIVTAGTVKQTSISTLKVRKLKSQIQRAEVKNATLMSERNIELLADLPGLLQQCFPDPIIAKVNAW